MSRYRCHVCQQTVECRFEDGDVIKRADHPAPAWRCPSCRPPRKKAAP